MTVLNKIILAADIGGTNIRLAIISANSQILSQCQSATNSHQTPEKMVEWLHTQCNDMLRSLNLEFAQIMAISICAPNANQFNGTIHNAPNLPWHGTIYLREMIIAAFAPYSSKFNVYILNDANAAAMGEMIYGGAKNMNNFVEITIGTGLGSGIIIDGKLLLGEDSFAGELGHTIIDPSPYGRECNCGRKGCLERYVSATGMQLTLNEFLTYDPENEFIYNIFNQYIDIEPTLIDLSPLQIDDPATMIAEAAKGGDKLALMIFDITAHYLALALANYVAIASPQAIFLYGGVTNAGDLLLKPTSKYFKSMLMDYYKSREIPILRSNLPNSDAALLGATAYAINQSERIDL